MMSKVPPNKTNVKATGMVRYKDKTAAAHATKPLPMKWPKAKSHRHIAPGAM